MDSNSNALINTSAGSTASARERLSAVVGYAVGGFGRNTAGRETPIHAMALSSALMAEVADVAALLLANAMTRSDSGRTMFTDEAITELCAQAVRELGGDAKFHPDAWLLAARAKGIKEEDNRELDELDPSSPDADPELLRRLRRRLEAIPWVKLLLEEEKRVPGFVRTLCNFLKMEERLRDGVTATVRGNKEYRGLFL